MKEMKKENPDHLDAMERQRRLHAQAEVVAQIMWMDAIP